jgi:hypothetical protein
VARPESRNDVPHLETGQDEAKKELEVQNLSGNRRAEARDSSKDYRLAFTYIHLCTAAPMVTQDERVTQNTVAAPPRSLGCQPLP